MSVDNTDRFVRQVTGKQPLDVGADRIARAAWAALSLLHKVREQSGQRIQLAWHNRLTEPACIEVDPAATLVAHEVPSRGYKGGDLANQERRATILDRLMSWIMIPDVIKEVAIANDHVLDAIICLLAGADFLNGACDGPADAEVARRGKGGFGSGALALRIQCPAINLSQ